ncbi:hypothetical protein Tco_1458741 [Tanacetum coccineum]|uniref:Uncharacterized protein n=1 Tax=Tanacetum coccineum TaxID=301880 RepID=A0ABQ5BVA8_9ASTR
MAWGTQLYAIVERRGISAMQYLRLESGAETLGGAPGLARVGYHAALAEAIVVALCSMMDAACTSRLSASGGLVVYGCELCRSGSRPRLNFCIATIPCLGDAYSVERRTTERVACHSITSPVSLQRSAPTEALRWQQDRRSSAERSSEIGGSRGSGVIREARGCERAGLDSIERWDCLSGLVGVCQEAVVASRVSWHEISVMDKPVGAAACGRRSPSSMGVTWYMGGWYASVVVRSHLWGCFTLLRVISSQRLLALAGGCTTLCERAIRVGSSSLLSFLTTFMGDPDRVRGGSSNQGEDVAR